MSLIVFEGIDASGKSSQAKLLFNYLKNKNVLVQMIKFPRYETFFGKIAGWNLTGKIGGMKLTPYLACLPFALDRWRAKSKIKNWLSQGKTVIIDRYTWSSVAHQAAKAKNIQKVVNWILWLEYQFLGLPKESKVIYLDIMVEQSQELMNKRKEKVYVKGKDDAEKDVKYQKKVLKIYRQLAKKNPHWIRVNNYDQQGKLLSLKKIFKLVVDKIF